MNQFVLTASTEVTVLSSVVHIRETPGNRLINNSKLFARKSAWPRGMSLLKVCRPAASAQTSHASLRPLFHSMLCDWDVPTVIVCVLIVHTRVDVFTPFWLASITGTLLNREGQSGVSGRGGEMKLSFSCCVTWLLLSVTAELVADEHKSSSSRISFPHGKSTFCHLLSLYLDQELNSYRYSSWRSCSSSSCWGDLFKIRLTPRRFKFEIWQECSLSKYALIDLIWRHTFKMTPWLHISYKKALLPGECTLSVCPAHMQQPPPVPDL